MTDRPHNTPNVSLRENWAMYFSKAFLDTNALWGFSHLRMLFDSKSRCLVISFGSDCDKDGKEISIQAEGKGAHIHCFDTLHGAGFVFLGSKIDLQYEKGDGNVFRFFLPRKDQMLAREILVLVYQNPLIVNMIRTSLNKGEHCGKPEISEKQIRDILKGVISTIK